MDLFIAEAYNAKGELMKQFDPNEPREDTGRVPIGGDGGAESENRLAHMDQVQPSPGLMGVVISNR